MGWAKKKEAVAIRDSRMEACGQPDWINVTKSHLFVPIIKKKNVIFSIFYFATFTFTVVYKNTIRFLFF